MGSVSTHQIVNGANLAILKDKFIHNFRRSSDQSETLPFQVSFNTTQTQIDSMSKKLARFVESKPKDYWQGNLNIVEIELNNRIKLEFSLTYVGNWQDGCSKALRKTSFLLKLRDILHEEKIEYTLCLQPVALIKETL